MVAQTLQRHAISYRVLGRTLAQADVETFRADSALPGAASVESHQRMTVVSAWKKELRTVAKGALYVPLAQPARAWCWRCSEPQAGDSLLAWGRFNNAF
ncbi:hypothetical protein LP420_18060 [Massilia sp. B-10]|nr:hypothetical protein LP420_18060 [Massilia sp. B-10]